MHVPEIIYDADPFDDILAKDDRYAPRAYALLMNVIETINRQHRQHFSSMDIMDEFREQTLDQFGPLSFDVLTEWGVTRTEDIGAMMFNLVDSHRVMKDDKDSPDDFVDGYDFREEFFDVFQA